MSVIYVYCKQRPKARTRIGFTKSAKMYVYNPRQHQSYEQAIKSAAQKQCKKIMTDSLDINISFYSSQKLRGDLDNYVKSVLDALQGVAFENDRQVDSLTATRWKGDKELTKIIIKGFKYFESIGREKCLNTNQFSPDQPNQNKKANSKKKLQEMMTTPPF